MLRTSFLLSCLLLSPLVSANPVVVRDTFLKLPFTKRINATNIKNVLTRDQARAANLRAHAEAKRSGNAQTRAAISVPSENLATSYIAEAEIGDDDNVFFLIVDTGSSNTWVGAGVAPDSTTAQDTGDEVAVEYGSGFFIGEEFVDTVDLGNGLVISGQSYGVAEESEGFDGVDGILGIGPLDLTAATLVTNQAATIPTVTDNLFSQGVISEHLVSVSFEPFSESNPVNGELTFGGTDSSKFTGSITFVPLTTTSPANEFWGIDQSITFGTSKTSILTKTAGIVDTGTTLLLIASDAFDRYTSATGAVQDETTGLLRLTTQQFSKLQSLNFNIGSTTFEFTANAQAWPRVLNTAIGGNTRSVYLIVGNLGTPTGEGFDFVNGQAFLERFFSVFDTANNRVGLATTSFTTSTSN